MQSNTITNTFVCYFKQILKAQRAELQRTGPGTKDGDIQYPGRIFRQNAQNGFLSLPLVLVGKKHTKLIYHMSWLYQ